jgi:uncharacterized protein
MPPSLAHGKICYLIIPAKDMKTSSGFYENVFGWNIRRRENGEVSFDDGVGEVSGMWVEGEKPVDAGFVHIMVDDAERTCKLIPQSGGVVLRQPDLEARDITAHFLDPAGNMFSIYEEKSLKKRGGA